ncbi:hypothetical protein UFOVP708_44 [uncultured Caudovirales phage]|uniref:Uncharacterized protein n=1 Tax=uncultured Caudovirales phage TaxID=2100421 RepID=A0A6J5NIA7_9CAUD|nr:hypothetical protein UFOVP708_44 [uncultured Caudovirales phage]
MKQQTHSGDAESAALEAILNAGSQADHEAAISMCDTIEELLAEWDEACTGVGPSRLVIYSLRAVVDYSRFVSESRLRSMSQAE